MKILFPLVVIFSSWFIEGCVSDTSKVLAKDVASELNVRQIDYDSSRVTKRFSQELKRVKNYIKTHSSSFSNERAILIDMRINSMYYRLFVVDLKNDSIISKGMVAHGSGSEIDGTDSLQFSNTPNSYMTSLGLYKVGLSYQGSFGKSYKLHGLEKTNDKAFVRAVVLHRYQCVPDTEQFDPICTSLGCAMVSENYFLTLEKIIDSQKKSVLMSIYY